MKSGDYTCGQEEGEFRGSEVSLVKPPADMNGPRDFDEERLRHIKLCTLPSSEAETR